MIKAAQFGLCEGAYPRTVHIVLFVPDLADSSRIRPATPGAVSGRTADDAAGADLVVVDLARAGHLVAGIRAAAPAARIVAFGPHADTDAFDRARRDGADAALARSRFFRDVASALGDDQTSGQG
jgi:hypothetical protein